MSKQLVYFKDLGRMDYQQAWDYQEKLLQENIAAKSRRQTGVLFNSPADPSDSHGEGSQDTTRNYLLFVEHPPVYTLGKSGRQENILIDREEMHTRGIDFFHTNRGGDITFHGPGQVVGYPILDLEKFYTDIGKYLRSLEEVIILTLDEFGIRGERSAGETGVWIDPGIKGMERKICAMGVRCSRWITMHGFALNINTDLSYFGHIVPCGIQDKRVTSLAGELGREIPAALVKNSVRENFGKVFDCRWRIY